MDFLTDRCFGCKAELEPAPGRFYCGACVERQLAAARAELEAYDEFQAWAHALVRGKR